MLRIYTNLVRQYHIANILSFFILTIFLRLDVFNNTNSLILDIFLKPHHYRNPWQKLFPKFLLKKTLICFRPLSFIERQHDPRQSCRKRD